MLSMSFINSTSEATRKPNQLLQQFKFQLSLFIYFPNNLDNSVAKARECREFWMRLDSLENEDGGNKLSPAIPEQYSAENDEFCARCVDSTHHKLMERIPSNRWAMSQAYVPMCEQCLDQATLEMASITPGPNELLGPGKAASWCLWTLRSPGLGARIGP
ncbi:hypothetical protein WDU94_008787 [Cyamophila willieti]